MTQQLFFLNIFFTLFLLGCASTNSTQVEPSESSNSSQKNPPEQSSIANDDFSQTNFSEKDSQDNFDSTTEESNFSQENSTLYTLAELKKMTQENVKKGNLEELTGAGSDADLAVVLLTYHFMPEKFLFLKDLTVLTPKQALVFQSWEGILLVLNGLTQLNTESAKILSSLEKVDMILLDGVMKMDLTTLQMLSEFNGTYLSLNGLQHLNESFATALSQFQGNSLSLNGLTRLEKKTAQALSQFQGRSIQLKGLKELEESSTKEIVQFQGKLTTSTEIEKQLQKYK